MTLKINLQKSVAEMLVLSILNNGTMYGYQLIQELEARVCSASRKVRCTRCCIA